MGFRLPFAGLLLAGLLSGFQPLWSQAGREKVLEGNRNYSDGNYDKALELYREALEESPDSPAIRFNLGDAQFKKEEMEEAADSFSRALQSEDPGIKSRAQYNLGNSLYRQGKLQESLSAYREALKVAPGDRDAKHNLEFVLKQLQEQQQQQNDQNQQDEGEQDKDKKQDESQSGNEDQSQQGRQDRPKEQEGQDQQDEEQQSQARNDRQDSEDPEQRPADQQENRDQKSRASGGQQEEPPQEGQAQASPDGAQPMSREEAERLLEALAQAQAGVKKKLELRPGTVKVEKDW